MQLLDWKWEQCLDRVNIIKTNKAFNSILKLDKLLISLYKCLKTNNEHVYYVLINTYILLLMLITILKGLVLPISEKFKLKKLR